MSLPAAATGPAVYYTFLIWLEPTQSHQRPILGPKPWVVKHAFSVQSLLAFQFTPQSSMEKHLNILLRHVQSSAKTDSFEIDTEPLEVFKC